MNHELRKEIEERAKAARTDDDYGWLAGVDIPALLSALDAAEARAVAAEERVRELEGALKFSYTLACRGVDRIDEENKTAGPRLSGWHRRRLTIMCEQIRKHVDQALKAQGSGE